MSAKLKKARENMLLEIKIGHGSNHLFFSVLALNLN